MIITAIGAPITALATAAIHIGITAEKLLPKTPSTDLPKKHLAPTSSAVKNSTKQAQTYANCRKGKLGEEQNNQKTNCTDDHQISEQSHLCNPSASGTKIHGTCYNSRNVGQ